MPGFLTRLGARLDTWGGAAKMVRFRTGWPAIATAKVKFFRTKKVQYRYLEAGSGPTIVFICDPPMTIEAYGPLVAVFERHFRLIVVELPAMGFSAATQDYTFGFLETNNGLAAFLRAVAGERSIFAFSCATSLAALDIAARMPELASHLTLLQAGGTEAFAIWKAARDPKGVLARPIMGQLVMGRTASKLMPQWYRLSVGRKEQIPNFCACAEQSFSRGAMWSLASAYQIYLRPREELPRPPQPILSIWGAADRSHPTSNAHSIARLYTSVRTVTFDDLGHTPELEAPERVLTAILDFVGTP